MKLRATAVILATALTAGAGRAQDESPRLTTDFGDWNAACDNTRSCTAVGFAADGAGGGGPHLYVARGGRAGDAARVEIGIGYSDEADALKNGDQVEVAVDGPRALRFTAQIKRGRESYEWPDLVLPPDRSAAFLEAIIGGSRVTLKHGDAELGAASLTGSSAALRWIDDRQKRAGTVTALVARGARPASAVPAPPAVPTMRLAPVMRQTGLPTALPTALASREDVKLCAEEYDAGEPRKPGVARLSATEYLWQVHCGSGAYNFDTLYIIARRDGTGARSPGFTNGANGPDHLINGIYDPKTRRLEAFAKGRGLGDCGDDAARAWDGRSFRLVRHAVMETCLGVTAEHWPVVWRGRTAG